MVRAFLLAPPFGQESSQSRFCPLYAPSWILPVRIMVDLITSPVNTRQLECPLDSFWVSDSFSITKGLKKSRKTLRTTMRQLPNSAYALGWLFCLLIAFRSTASAAHRNDAIIPTAPWALIWSAPSYSRNVRGNSSAS